MSSQSFVQPSLFRIFAAIFYDLIVVCGILMVAGFAIVPIYHMVAHQDAIPAGNWFFRVLLYLIVFSYYAFSWQRGGQTIGMKSWKLKLISNNEVPPTLLRYFLRYVGGQLSCAIALLGYIMIWLGPRHLMLHDLLSQTRMISLKQKSGN